MLPNYTETFDLAGRFLSLSEPRKKQFFFTRLLAIRKKKIRPHQVQHGRLLRGHNQAMVWICDNFFSSSNQSFFYEEDMFSEKSHMVLFCRIKRLSFCFALDSVFLPTLRTVATRSPLTGIPRRSCLKAVPPFLFPIKIQWLDRHPSLYSKPLVCFNVTWTSHLKLWSAQRDKANRNKQNLQTRNFVYKCPVGFTSYFNLDPPLKAKTVTAGPTFAAGSL